MFGVIKNLGAGIRNKAGRVGLETIKRKPEIALGIGIVCGLAGTVLACKATLACDEILDDHQDMVDRINAAAEKVDDEGKSEKYTDDDMRKDMTIAYAKTGARIAKAFLPAVACGVASIGLVLYSHGLMVGQVASATAMAAAASESFANYRKSVREELGEEMDRHFRFGTAVEERGYEVTDPETGEKKIVQKTVEYPTRCSDYAKIFDAANKNWQKNAEYNMFFLRRVEQIATDKLRAKGYLFLNEVYEMLDFPATIAGQRVGWLYDSKHPEQNYIDFGIFNPDSEANRRFVNGYEENILLDFNVYGDLISGNAAGLGSV